MLETEIFARNEFKNSDSKYLVNNSLKQSKHAQNHDYKYFMLNSSNSLFF